MKNKLRQILKKYWGYADFRPGQLEIIESIITNKYTFGLLTTGGGKSICYQVAGLYLGGVTIVISPLLSLMQDQVDRLNKEGVSARYYNSLLNHREKENVLADLYAGECQFLYLSPEALKNQNLLSALSQVQVSLVTIDEAHCISIWGHDFRPAYLDIKKQLVNISAEHHLAAFTATATKKVQQDIVAVLGMRSPKSFVNTFMRENLSINILKNINDDELQSLVQGALKVGDVLVYSYSRKRVEELTLLFSNNGIEAASYHAGVEKSRRVQIQSDFISKKLRLVVATNAFGMGVDKPDIYTVIHDAIPDSLENYYQEAGRAGRDGRESKSYVNLNWNGINVRRLMIENGYLAPELVNKVYNFLTRRLRENKSTASIIFTYKEMLLELSGINYPRLIKALKIFQEKGIISEVSLLAESSKDELEAKRTCKILLPNLLFLFPKVNFGKDKRLFENSKTKLKKMVEMCSGETCRMRFILNYFGENSREDCGKCDICKSS